MCIFSYFSRRDLPRKLQFLWPRGCLEARFILKDCFQVRMVENRSCNRGCKCLFSRLAESALFCANFAVAPAGLICLACAFWQSRCENWQRLVQIFGGRWVYTACVTLCRGCTTRLLPSKKTAKQVQRVACSGFFSKLFSHNCNRTPDGSYHKPALPKKSHHCQAFTSSMGGECSQH